MAKKKQRPAPPDWLVREIEAARRDAQHHEENGQLNTSVHQKLARLEAELARFLEVNNGTSTE